MSVVYVAETNDAGEWVTGNIQQSLSPIFKDFWFNLIYYLNVQTQTRVDTCPTHTCVQVLSVGCSLDLPVTFSRPLPRGAREEVVHLNSGWRGESTDSPADRWNQSVQMLYQDVLLQHSPPAHLLISHNSARTRC